jgi:fructosamine-3-kinase
MRAVVFWRRFAWNQVAESISNALGKTFSINSQPSLSGGSINQTFMISGDGQRYFVKANDSSTAEVMFKVEQLGLEELRSTGSIRIPNRSVPGVVGNKFLAYFLVKHFPVVVGLAVFLGADAIVKFRK